MSLFRHGVSVGMLLIAALPACAGSPKPYYEKARQGDGFTFWGWSEDGQSFATEIWTDGGGLPLDCFDEAVLTVVDAARDRPVTDGVLRSVTKPGADSDRCVNPDVRATLAPQRPAHLRRHHVTVRAERPLALRTGAEKGRGTLKLPSGHLLHAQLILHEVDLETVIAHPDEPASSYRLTLTVDGAVVRTIDAGPWPSALGTELESTLVFVSPTGRFAALCLPIAYVAHHSFWTRWDCHGTPLTH